MTICTSNLINWNIYFKCINCDLGQKVVRGNSSVSDKIGTRLEDKVLYLVALWGIGATSGYILGCRCYIWLHSQVSVLRLVVSREFGRWWLGPWLHPEVWVLHLVAF